MIEREAFFMKKIEAYIRPDKLEDIKEMLGDMKINGLSITQIMGCGNQKGWKVISRNAELEYNFLPKIKIELVVQDDQVEPIIEKIITVSRTGDVGDGKIFIYDVADAIRIRTAERGNAAIK
jgi:nitrogen regulatory protein P-II 1